MTKLAHHCSRGPTLRLASGARCPLCGIQAGVNPGDGIDLVDRLRELDARDDVDLNSWEASFVDSLLKRVNQLTDRQTEKALEILERYE